MTGLVVIVLVADLGDARQDVAVVELVDVLVGVELAVFLLLPLLDVLLDLALLRLSGWSHPWPTLSAGRSRYQ